MSVQENIAKAKEAALANAQAAPVPVVNSEPTPNQAVQQSNHSYDVASTALSVVDAVNGSMSVDFWLKVQAGVVEVDGKSYRKIPCLIKCADAHAGGSIQAFIGINYGGDNDAKYSKTFAGRVVEDGENLGMDWNSHVQQVQAIYPNAKTFNGFAIVFEVAEDFADLDNANPIPKGTLLGYSTSKTSAKEVSKLVRKLIGEKYWGNPEDLRLLKVNGKANSMTNKEGKPINWNTLSLEDAGKYEEVDESDLAE